VPSRKQRRRRQKGRRHEYEYVYVDEEGREVEVDEEEDEPRPARKSTARAKPSSRTGGRAGRVVEPPSWRRVGRRALVLGPILVLLMFLLKPKNATTAGVVVQALLFLIIFLPFSYLMDTMLYRSYLKRTGRAPSEPERRTKEPKPKT
jgi:hypothetical protein